MGDGETRSEDGVAFDAYPHVLPGMQQTAAKAMDGVIDLRSEE